MVDGSNCQLTHPEVIGRHCFYNVTNDNGERLVTVCEEHKLRPAQLKAHSLQVYGDPFNHVTDFKYLGSKLASAASDLKRRKALAWRAF